MKNKLINTSILSLFVLLLFSVSAFANKTSVKIITPQSAKAGSKITIKIEVNHKGNSAKHYTKGIIVKVNGKEYEKWEYTKNKLPKSQNFTLEFKINTESKLEIEVEGNCSKHGSKGTKKVIMNIE
jgi:desulfoferrodoxin (superoxide reductase-like protein)